jgi:general secretion pathway protein N
VGLVSFFPARVAYRWFAPPALALGDISGSVWRGSAGEAAAGGVYLRDCSWHIQPLSLFAGELSYSIEASPVSGFINANVALGITGTITVTDLTASLPLRAVESATGVPDITGSLSVQFRRLKFENGLLVAADGILEVADLVVPIVHSASIGGYRADFFTQESGVMASVEDTDGVIDLAGSLQISPDGDYRFVGQLAAKPNTPADVRQQMQFLPPANKAGQYEFRLEGQL